MAFQCRHCQHNIVNAPAGMVRCPGCGKSFDDGERDDVCPTCKRPFAPVEPVAPAGGDAPAGAGSGFDG